MLAYRTTLTSSCLRLRAGLVPRIDSRICIRSSPSHILSTGAQIRHITRSGAHNHGRKSIVASAEAGNSGTDSNLNESQPPDGNVGDQKASTKRAVDRWWRKFSKQLKSELGLDTEEASRLSGELAEDSAALAGLVRETTEASLQENLPQTVDSVKGKLRKFKEWNSPQLWKVRKYICVSASAFTCSLLIQGGMQDVRKWGLKRWAVFLLALALGAMAARGSCRLTVAAPRRVEAAAETWMDMAVPDPTPQNLQR